MKPIEDRIIVKPLEEEIRTASGIIIPTSAKRKPNKGTVIAVGWGTLGVEMKIKEGDTILFSENTGTEIEIKEEKYLIMRQGEALAIV